jgi:uncharacterized damage-inducible protein DinB
MDTMLSDLLGHQAWADARQWHALEKHAGALADRALRERLHHIHLVQAAFLALVRGAAPKLTKVEDYPDLATLKAEAVSYHADAAAWLDAADDSRLEEPVTVPWAPDGPTRVTARQALVQSVMHSHYHRAQNATRLRELGGQPPVTDFILWLWQGRPAARWD